MIKYVGKKIKILFVRHHWYDREIIIKEEFIMLMKPEQARQMQIDFRKQEEANELKLICNRIQENLKEGQSTKIYKDSVKSKEILKAIEKMGYTVIDNPYDNKYIITVDPQEIANENREINRDKICERVAKVTSGLFATVFGIGLICSGKPLSYILLGIFALLIVYCFFRVILNMILLAISHLFVPAQN